MGLILGRTKYQKFESILVLAVIVVGLLAYGASQLIDFSGKETKAVVSGYITQSATKEVDCTWAGYAEHRKTGLLQVFVSCNPRNQIPTEINSESQLYEAIAVYVVTPSIEALPLDNNLSVVSITQIDEKTVVCTDIRQRIIKAQWLDSYENYCWP